MTGSFFLVTIEETTNKYMNKDTKETIAIGVVTTITVLMFLSAPALTLFGFPILGLITTILGLIFIGALGVVAYIEQKSLEKISADNKTQNFETIINNRQNNEIKQQIDKAYREAKKQSNDTLRNKQLQAAFGLNESQLKTLLQNKHIEDNNTLQSLLHNITGKNYSNLDTFTNFKTILTTNHKAEFFATQLRLEANNKEAKDYFIIRQKFDQNKSIGSSLKSFLGKKLLNNLMEKIKQQNTYHKDNEMSF